MSLFAPGDELSPSKDSIIDYHLPFCLKSPVE